MVAPTSFTRAAVLLATAANLASAGSAIVHNQCDFDVMLWSVSEVSGGMKTLAANGGEYTEAYQTNPDGGGISIKVGRDTTGQNITQYEYTLEGSSLWYDLSLINGNPFSEFGVSIVPSDASCNAVICPAGVELCAAAYMVPTDNWATAECAATADTVMILCSGEEDTNGSASISSVVSSAVKTASAVTEFSSTAATVVASTTEDVESTVSTSTASAASTTAAWWSIASDASTTSAPTHVSDPDVVVHTTFVTYVVTVVERDAAPEPTAAAPVKRQIHRHEHGQQKRHGHAHA